MTARHSPLQRLRQRILARPSATQRNLARHFAKGGSPVVLTDANDMRFVLYPWELDAVDELLSKSFYTPDFQAIARLLRTGDTAVDVGANIGSHSIMMSRCVGADGSVFAFEPVPTTAWLMRENLALNKVDNVHLTNAAVSKAPGTLTMNVYDQRYSAWNSVGYASFDGVVPVDTVTVTAESLDDAMRARAVDHLHFLKIDVEGFEIDVLRGAWELLASGSVDCLSFEISQVPLEASGHTAKEVFEFLESLDFDCYKFDSSTDTFTGPFDDSQDFYDNFYASRHDLRTR